MSEVVYLQIGASGLKQFEVAYRNLKQVEPELKVILYTDQPEDLISHLDYDEYRYWPSPIGNQTSSVFGTNSFGSVTLEKPKVMLDALEKCDHWVLFSDVDILACRPFREDLNGILKRKSFWVSCEGNEIMPRNHCTGLIAIKPDGKCHRLINNWIEHHEQLLCNAPETHDQTAFNDLMHLNPDMELQVGVFPLGYAMPGWLFPLVHPHPLSRVSPAFFHCNWVKGHQAKLDRMLKVERSIGTRPSWWSFFNAILKLDTYLWRHHRPSFRFWMSRN